MFKHCALALAFIFVGLFSSTAKATVIEFTPSSGDPNYLDSPHPGQYGSDANVSVSYSGYTFLHPGGYGTLDGGTGAAAYSDVEFVNTGESFLTIYFTANPGYTVTLDSFDLATYQGLPESVNISVTGGSSSYTLSNATPSATTFTTYSPDVTGTALAIMLTDFNLYDIGINTIVYSENVASATPEPASVGLLAAGLVLTGLAAVQRRRTHPR